MVLQNTEGLGLQESDEPEVFINGPWERTAASGVKGCSSAGQVHTPHPILWDPHTPLDSKRHSQAPLILSILAMSQYKTCIQAIKPKFNPKAASVFH